MKPSRAVAYSAGLWSSIFPGSRAGEPDCHSKFLIINSAVDAKAIARSCPLVRGSIVLNNTAVFEDDIDLSGVKYVGSILDRCSNLYYSELHDGSCSPDDIPIARFTLKSSTLTDISNYFGLSGLPGLAHLSFPKLRYVRAMKLWDVPQLETLDISSLTNSSSLTLNASNLQSIIHDTSYELMAQLVVADGQMDSLDNLTSSGGWLYDLTILPLPNLNVFTVDFEPRIMRISGNGNLSVILGSSSVTSLNILGMLSLNGGVRSLERHPSLESLSLYAFLSQSGNNMTELTLPFDDLTILYVWYEPHLERLRNTPSAVKWGSYMTGAQTKTTIKGCPKLDLTSQFTEDENGTRDQTWWWSQYISDVDISGNVTEHFFDTILDRAETNGPETTPLISSTFVVGNPYDPTNKTINCDEFDELYTQHRLNVSTYECWGTHSANPSSSTSSENNSAGRMPSGFGQWLLLILPANTTVLQTGLPRVTTLRPIG